LRSGKVSGNPAEVVIIKNISAFASVIGDAAKPFDTLQEISGERLGGFDFTLIQFFMVVPFM